MHRSFVSSLCQRIAYVALACSCPLAASADVHITEVGQLMPPINVQQMVYDAAHGLLIARNSGSTIAVIKTSDGSSTLHASTYLFTDLSLSPQGGVLYASDYGSENIGYGTPAKQNYVHRLDLESGAWAVQKAVLAGNVQAVDDDTFVLKSDDQWITFTYDAWGTGTAIMQLNSDQTSFPGYYPGVYEGNFVYDAKYGRLIHGNNGLSSQELQAFVIVDDEFAKQEGTGDYGSAQGYGGTLCLSTDGATVYYGKLAVDALDVTHVLRTFFAPIYAATADVAFAESDYYDVHTGHQVDSLAFGSTIYALSVDGKELWAYDATGGLLHHYTIDVDGKPPVMLDGGMPPVVTDAATPPSVQDAATPTAVTDAATPPVVADAAVPAVDASVPPGSDDASTPSSDLDAGASGDAAIASLVDAGASKPDASATAHAGDAALARGDAGDDTGDGDAVAPQHHDDGCSLSGSGHAHAPASAAGFALALLLLLRRRARRSTNAA